MKKILIVVDMQNDFIDGSLANPAAQAIVPNCVNKVKNFKDDMIVLTMDTHDKDYLNTTEGKNLPVEHCIECTDGWKINSKIFEAIPSVSMRTISKRFFGYKNWKYFFEEERIQPTEIELIGTATDICVVSNALLLKTLFPDCKITVDASCCAGITQDKHKAALEVMKSCQINVTNE